MNQIYDQNYDLIQNLQPDATYEAFAHSLDEWLPSLFALREGWQTLATNTYAHINTGTEITTTTLSDFVFSNQFAPQELVKIAHAVKTKSEYHGGGGAAGDWSVTFSVGQ